MPNRPEFQDRLPTIKTTLSRSVRNGKRSCSSSLSLPVSIIDLVLSSHDLLFRIQRQDAHIAEVESQDPG